MLAGGLALTLGGGDGDSAQVEPGAPSAADAPAPEPRPAGRADDPPPRERPQGVNAGSVRVSVLSGADIPRLAARTGQTLERRGFRLVEVANAPGPSAESFVLFAAGARRQAASVARVLDIEAVRPLDAPNRAVAGDAQVVVVAGADRGDR